MTGNKKTMQAIKDGAPMSANLMSVSMHVNRVVKSTFAFRSERMRNAMLGANIMEKRRAEEELRKIQLLLS